MRGAEVVEGHAEGTTSQPFLDRREVDDLAREERNPADVVAQSIPPLKREFTGGKRARWAGEGSQGGLDKANHRLQAGRTRWERGVDQVVVLTSQEASKVGRRGTNVLPHATHAHGRTGSRREQSGGRNTCASAGASRRGRRVEETPPLGRTRRGGAGR